MQRINKLYTIMSLLDEFSMSFDSTGVLDFLGPDFCSKVFKNACSKKYEQMVKGLKDKKGIWNYIIHETLNITLQNKFNQN